MQRVQRIKLIKLNRLWILVGKSNDWSLGFNITKRSIDVSLLPFWFSVEIN